MLIRPAKKEDGRSAAVLIHMAIKDIAEALTGETDIPAILHALEEFYRQDVNRLGYRNCVAAEVNGELAGILIHYHGCKAGILDKPIIRHLRKNGKNTAIDQEAKETDFYIDTISVHPDYQRRGVGTQLIKASLSAAKKQGHQRVSLNVEQDNVSAYKLYTRLGFLLDDEIMINGHRYFYMVKKEEQ